MKSITKKTAFSPAGGFTLIEINLVLLLFAGAIMGLLGLIPVGLKQGSMATSDTTCEAFAENVLGRIEGSARTITDYSVWRDRDRFASELLKGVSVDGQSIAEGGDEVFGNGSYLGVPRANISYRLDISEVDESFSFRTKLYKAAIWVTDSKGASPRDNSPYVVYMAYTGVVP